MSPDLFIRLAAQARAAYDAPADQAPRMLQRRLARLAARRLERRELPQRSYLWWNRGDVVQPAGCLG